MTQTKDSSMELIIDEATSRGIDVVAFPDINKFVYTLVLDDHREYMYASCPGGTSLSSYKIIFNKALAAAYLREGGFPVPAEIITSSIDEMKALLATYGKIVIKPIDSTWGKGVTAGITEARKIPKAFKYASQNRFDKKEPRIVCQEHVDGEEYRVLVVGGEHVFAAHRIPAGIMGDGQSTVKQLIARHNDSAKHGRVITITDTTHQLLTEQGLKMRSVPEEGERVQVRLVANAHGGGTVADATDIVCDEAKDIAKQIASYLNVSVLGVDYKSSDITSDPGKILEINSTPDITLHHFPTTGESRNVAGTMVDVLFPETVEHSDVAKT